MTKNSSTESNGSQRAAFWLGRRCLRPWLSRARPPNARWQFSETPPPAHPRALGRVGPSCHLSNDFFILQEEPVARGNAPLPARRKPDAGIQADAGTRYVCSLVTEGPTRPFIPPVFLCFLFPPSVHTVVGVTPRSLSSGSHFVLEGRKLSFASW